MNRTVICDTNLLVSAAIFLSSIPAQAYEKAASNFELIASDETLRESAEVVQRPKFDKYVSQTARQHFFDTYQKRALLVEVTHSVSDCRDSRDDKFLNLALSCAAFCIVSGDKDLPVLHPYRGIEILSPAEFLE